MRPGGLALTERALSRCGFSPGARVLDLGCGAGATVEYLIERRGLRAAGIDRSPTILGIGLERRGPLPLISALGEELPLAADTWDGIFSECALSVMRCADRVLSECGRVLKHGGRLVLSDLYLSGPDAAQKARGLPPNCCLAGAATREDLAAKLGAHGFRIVFWEDHSPALKTFAAGLVFSHGSLERYWQAACGDGEGAADPRSIVEAFSRARPGYFLLIARKHAGR